MTANIMQSQVTADSIKQSPSFPTDIIQTSKSVEEYYIMNSLQVADHETRSLFDFNKYSAIIIAKYQKCQQTNESIDKLLLELISLAEFTFDERLFKKYGPQRQMLILDKMKLLYPGQSETQAFLETMIVERIHNIIKTNNRRQMRVIYNNILGIVAQTTGCIRMCMM